MVFLEVTYVTQIEKPGTNKDTIVAVVNCNKDNSNEVGDWKILHLVLLLLVLVVGSVFMIFNFPIVHKKTMYFCA